MSAINPETHAIKPLSPGLQQHLADAKRAKEVADEKDRAKRAVENPTEPDASTEQQST